MPHRLLNARGLHPLKALPVRIVDLWNLVFVLLELRNQLRRVQFAVAPARLNDLGLFLEAKVLPGKGRSDNVPEQRQDFVMRNGARVGKVVDTNVAVLGEEDGCWQQVREDGVAVGNVHHVVVFGDLGDKVSGVQVIRNWHAQTEDQAAGVVLDDLEECQD